MLVGIANLLAEELGELGAIHFVFMDWRHIRELLVAGSAVYSELKNVVVWVKSNAGQGSFYRSQHELIFVYKNGDAPHINNFELGQHGRSRSNVWTYAGVNTFRAGRLDDLSVHPTVKPVALVADAMRDCSRRGNIVLDPFMGARLWPRARPTLCRCRGPALAGLHEARCPLGRHQHDL
jgi:hypothetical protein